MIEIIKLYEVFRITDNEENQSIIEVKIYPNNNIEIFRIHVRDENFVIQSIIKLSKLLGRKFII
jgi:hypothetical protein